MVYFDDEQIWLVPADSPLLKQPLTGEYMLLEDGYSEEFELPYSERKLLQEGSLLNGSLVISDADEGGK